MRMLLMVLLLIAGFDTSADDAAVQARGRELSALFVAGDTAAIWAQMAPGMQRFLRSEEAFAKFANGVRKDIGTETEVVSESVKQDIGFATYRRESRWSNAALPYLMEWSISTEGKVVGFVITDEQRTPEPAPSKYLDYATRAQLRLPFDGEWTVSWGGRTLEQNHHVPSPQQRFAYDLSVVRDGRRHRGDGSRAEDYYCWDAPIRAPAGGTVVSAVGDLPDQKPGEMDRKNLAGNHVILDLGNAEYALLAHLRQGSVRVKAGDIVESGAELGRCGNSGNTTEPHLHFHLQDSPRFGEGEGLPAFFVDYVADGTPVARGEPVKGQLIRAR